MDKVTRQVSTNHNLFEEKGEPKRYRTEVLPLTPYRSRCSTTDSCTFIFIVRVYEKHLRPIIITLLYFSIKDLYIMMRVLKCVGLLLAVRLSMWC